MAEEVGKRSKERFFRGIQVEELMKMDTREFAKLVKSRPRRAILRNYDVVEKFVKKCENRTKKNRPIRTHNRALIIVPGMLGKTVGIHNGKEYVKLIITEQMLGHRLGEFSLTRKITKHGSAGIGATKSSENQSKK